MRIRVDRSELPGQGTKAEPVRIQNPAKSFDHVKREILAVRFFEIPAAAIDEMQNRV
jgi:hypothetical protein